MTTGFTTQCCQSSPASTQNQHSGSGGQTTPSNRPGASSGSQFGISSPQYQHRPTPATHVVGTTPRPSIITKPTAAANVRPPTNINGQGSEVHNNGNSQHRYSSRGSASLGQAFTYDSSSSTVLSGTGYGGTNQQQQQNHHQHQQPQQPSHHQYQQHEQAPQHPPQQTTPNYHHEQHHPHQPHYTTSISTTPTKPGNGHGNGNGNGNTGAGLHGSVQQEVTVQVGGLDASIGQGSHIGITHESGHHSFVHGNQVVQSLQHGHGVSDIGATVGHGSHLDVSLFGVNDRQNQFFGARTTPVPWIGGENDGDNSSDESVSTGTVVTPTGDLVELNHVLGINKHLTGRGDGVGVGGQGRRPSIHSGNDSPCYHNM